MYKIAKQMKKEKKDVTGAKCIKDERGVIKNKGRRDTWEVEGLLNDENEHNLEEINMVEGLTEEISKEDVKRALKKKKSGKVPGSTGMTSDLMKGESITGELTRVFSGIVDEGEIPKEWKNSVTVPIYKGKGDALECGKYREIRLVEYEMKLFKKVLEEKLKKLEKVAGRQFGFCPGRSQFL